MHQTVPFDEIVLIDDGSTDGSLDFTRKRYGHLPQVRLIAQSNQGQLAAFNRGFAASSGDAIFFLDADDLYEKNYVERVIAIYQRDSMIDFVFCARRTFGRFETPVHFAPRDQDLGYSVISTLNKRRWIGAPTSCLSMRRHILEKILPSPYLDDWRTRADDCLVLGASVVGARKFYLNETLVRYRVHEGNSFYGKPYGKYRVYQHRLAVNRFLEMIIRRMGYNRLCLTEFTHREFRTIAQPTFQRFNDYVWMALRADVGIGKRIGMAISIFTYYMSASSKMKTSKQPLYRTSPLESRTR